MYLQNSRETACLCYGRFFPCVYDCQMSCSSGKYVRVSSILILLAVALRGCSTTKDSQKIRSIAHELHTTAAEAVLLVAFLDGGHSTSPFAKGHPVYLEQTLQDAKKNLASIVAHTENA